MEALAKMYKIQQNQTENQFDGKLNIIFDEINNRAHIKESQSFKHFENLCLVEDDEFHYYQIIDPTTKKVILKAYLSENDSTYFIEGDLRDYKDVTILSKQYYLVIGLIKGNNLMIEAPQIHVRCQISAKFLELKILIKNGMVEKNAEIFSESLQLEGNELWVNQGLMTISQKLIFKTFVNKGTLRCSMTTVAGTTFKNNGSSVFINSEIKISESLENKGTMNLQGGAINVKRLVNESTLLTQQVKLTACHFINQMDYDSQEDMFIIILFQNYGTCKLIGKGQGEHLFDTLNNMGSLLFQETSYIIKEQQTNNKILKSTDSKCNCEKFENQKQGTVIYDRSTLIIKQKFENQGGLYFNSCRQINIESLVYHQNNGVFSLKDSSLEMFQMTNVGTYIASNSNQSFKYFSNLGSVQNQEGFTEIKEQLENKNKWVTGKGKFKVNHFKNYFRSIFSLLDQNWNLGSSSQINGCFSPYGHVENYGLIECSHSLTLTNFNFSKNLRAIGDIIYCFKDVDFDLQDLDEILSNDIKMNGQLIIQGNNFTIPKGVYSQSKESIKLILSQKFANYGKWEVLKNLVIETKGEFINGQQGLLGEIIVQGNFKVKAHTVNNQYGKIFVNGEAKLNSCIGDILVGSAKTLMGQYSFRDPDDGGGFGFFRLVQTPDRQCQYVLSIRNGSYIAAGKNLKLNSSKNVLVDFGELYSQGEVIIMAYFGFIRNTSGLITSRENMQLFSQTTEITKAPNINATYDYWAGKWHHTLFLNASGSGPGYLQSLKDIKFFCKRVINVCGQIQASDNIYHDSKIVASSGQSTSNLGETFVGVKNSEGEVQYNPQIPSTGFHMRTSYVIEEVRNYAGDRRQLGYKKLAVPVSTMAGKNIQINISSNVQVTGNIDAPTISINCDNFNSFGQLSQSQNYQTALKIDLVQFGKAIYNENSFIFTKNQHGVITTQQKMKEGFPLNIEALTKVQGSKQQFKSAIDVNPLDAVLMHALAQYNGSLNLDGVSGQDLMQQLLYNNTLKKKNYNCIDELMKDVQQPLIAFIANNIQKQVSNHILSHPMLIIPAGHRKPFGLANGIKGKSLAIEARNDITLQNTIINLEGSSPEECAAYMNAAGAFNNTLEVKRRPINKDGWTGYEDIIEQESQIFVQNGNIVIIGKNGITMKGTQTESKNGSVSLISENGSVITLPQLLQMEIKKQTKSGGFLGTGRKTNTFIKAMRNNHQCTIKAAEYVDIISGKTQIHQATNILGKGGVNLKCSGDMQLLEGQNSKMESHEQKGGFLLFKKNNLNRTTTIQSVGPTIQASSSKDINIQSKAQVNLQNVTMKGKNINLVGQKVSIEVGKNLRTVEFTDLDQGIFWTTMKQRNEQHLEFKHSTFDGQLNVLASEIVIQKIENQTLPYIEKLQKQFQNVQVEEMEEQHLIAEQSFSGPSVGLLAFVALCTGLYAPGMHTTLASTFKINAAFFQGTAMKATFATTVRIGAVSLVQNKGSPIDAIKSMLKIDTLKSLAIDVVGAIGIEKLSMQLNIKDSYAQRTLIENVLKNMVHSSVNVALQISINGKKPEDAFQDGLLSVVAGTLGEYFAPLIMKERFENRMDYGQHKFAHGILGAVIGSIISEDPIYGAISGATGAIIAEVLCEEMIPILKDIPPELVKKLQNQEVQDALIRRCKVLTGAFCLSAGLDVNTGSYTSNNAIENNFMAILLQTLSAIAFYKELIDLFELALDTYNNKTNKDLEKTIEIVLQEVIINRIADLAGDFAEKQGARALFKIAKPILEKVAIRIKQDEWEKFLEQPTVRAYTELIKDKVSSWTKDKLKLFQQHKIKEAEARKERNQRAQSYEEYIWKYHPLRKKEPFE